MNSRLLTGIGIESRRAFRGLSRSPGFSVGVVLVLGIAIAGMVTVATATVVVSTTVPPATLSDEVRATVERVLGADRIGDIVTMGSLVRRAVRDREPQLILLGLFGVEVLALAGIGCFPCWRPLATHGGFLAN